MDIASLLRQETTHVETYAHLVDNDPEELALSPEIVDRASDYDSDDDSVHDHSGESSTPSDELQMLVGTCTSSGSFSTSESSTPSDGDDEYEPDLGTYALQAGNDHNASDAYPLLSEAQIVQLSTPDQRPAQILIDMSRSIGKGSDFDAGTGDGTQVGSWSTCGQKRLRSAESSRKSSQSCQAQGLG